jgi:hypothetical protein
VLAPSLTPALAQKHVSTYLNKFQLGLQFVTQQNYSFLLGKATFGLYCIYEVLSKSSRTAAKNIGLTYHPVEVVFLKVLSFGGYTAIPGILPLLDTFLELFFLNGVYAACDSA